MGKAADAPDYTPMANASAEAARIMGDLGQRQLDFSQQQYYDTKPLFDRIVNSQMASQDEQLAQGRDYYDYMRQTFRPLEQQMVSDAQNFNSEAYREQLAQQAAADAGLAFQQTKAGNARAMASMGVNPNSGRFAGQERASDLGLAAMKANAMTGTRQQAEAMGHARQAEAVGLGRGLPGASTGAYAAAMNAGNSAGQNSQAAGLNYMAGMGQAANTYNAGFGLQMQGLNSILGSQTSIYNQSANNQAGMWGSLAGLAGMGLMGPLGGAAAYGLTNGGYNWKGSDRRLKQDIVEVGVYPNGLPKYEFAYKDAPDIRWRGVMADDVAERFPEAVTPNAMGYQMVNYRMLGIVMEGV